MKDIFMFCDDAYDCRCDGYCCQECKRDQPEKYAACNNHCDNIKFKEAVYRGEHDDKLVGMLEELTVNSNIWLAVIAVERFNDLLKFKKKIESLHGELKHGKEDLPPHIIAERIEEIMAESFRVERETD